MGSPAYWKGIASMMQRPSNKRPIVDVIDNEEVKVYKFRILLPNGTSLGLKLCDPKPKMPIEEFVEAVKSEYFKTTALSDSATPPRRRVMWRSKDLYFKDAFEKKIGKSICFQDFKPHKCHILRLHDGSADVASNFEKMWDLTPDTDLLTVLPKEYNFESALADLIDNSLQAVWCIAPKERRLISLEIGHNKITIFDTGLGMDGSDDNSIVKWGKMGASIHRTLRLQAIGVKPPFLMPFFGMFGYGGPMASMHLGRRALVSSKTKESKKVFTLHLERDALLSRSGYGRTWKTGGGIRDLFEEEISGSPHGSFTMVEIFEPKLKNFDLLQLQCRLKDIYFPYIQCDELLKTGKTIMPIEFQVNGTNLAEIEGGEVATTNLHSCNGPEFVLDLHLKCNMYEEAHARLKCVYFPVVEGKESIDKILENLKAGGFNVSDKYETFSRVSIRRLGRLLPDARWVLLPFMEPRLKKGDKARILKRSCLRVKCFIDTDAGFDPTPYKSDLAHHHPYTTALKNLGNKPLEKDSGTAEINVEIFKDGKELSLLQLERVYQEWIFQMHDRYDEEIDCGEDQPVVVVNPLNKKKLGISSDVLRVHKSIKRKGASWKSGQKVKILKGAYSSCHKSNVYAILEFFVLEGFQGDAGGEARIICRPLGLSDDVGCILTEDSGNCNLDIRESLSLPISIIDSGKCSPIDTIEWDRQLEKQQQKAPSHIDILTAAECQELEVDDVLPSSAIYAGDAPPEEILAVVRPVCCSSSCGSRNLDQKYIFRDNLEMIMEIKKMVGHASNLEKIYSRLVKPSSRKGFHGLYILPLRQKFSNLFKKKKSSVKSCEKRVTVKASAGMREWKLLSRKKSSPCHVRAGSYFPQVSITCCDAYDNWIPFTSTPEVIAKICANSGLRADVKKFSVELSLDKSSLVVKDVLIESGDLDKIRPDYGANLVISSAQDESYTVSVPCHVKPGTLQRVTLHSILDRQLCPGCVLQDLKFEMFDAYGNHAEEGSEVLFEVDGFCFEDKLGPSQTVDENGFIDLSGFLKVHGGYGKDVSISVQFENVLLFKEEFQTVKRELRAASWVCLDCYAGSQLRNLTFEVVDPEGHIDETIHNDEKCGPYHMLTLKSQLFTTDDSIQYAFRHGCCVIPVIPMPQKEGEFLFLAAHSGHPELNLTFKIRVLKSPESKEDSVNSQYPDGRILLLENEPNPPNADKSMLCVVNDIKDSEQALKELGLQIGDLEGRLNLLSTRKEVLQLELAELQASLEPDSVSHLQLYQKEVIMERIERKDDSAAGILCALSRRCPFRYPENNIMKDIVGIVALLGTVQHNILSRILAEYLGGEQMLAVVCTSYPAATALEDYLNDGKFEEDALGASATSLGKRVRGRYLVICLEDIRPYDRETITSDPQRKLILPDPILPDGKTPPGFMGYAVNMINLDVDHMQIRTHAGDGLRETLFYYLFGHLQVYETREYMNRARAIVKSSAISLDGGIMRHNGVLSLGSWEPDVCFPVVPPESQMLLSSESIGTRKIVEKKYAELRNILVEIARVTQVHQNVLMKFEESKQKHLKFLEETRASL